MASSEVSIIIQAVDKASGTLKKISGELSKTTKESGKGAGSFEALAAKAKLAWTALGVGIGVAAAVGKAMKSLSDGFMNYAFEVKDFGRIIGASAEEASKLIQVADDVRLSTESMTTAMRSAITKGYAPTIEGLGQMSDAYLAIHDPIQRSRYLIETFGRSGLEMAKLMELGGKRIQEMGDSIEGTGLLMTEEGVKAAEAYYRELDRLGDHWTSLKNKMAKPIMGVITVVTKEFNDQAESTQEVNAEIEKYHRYLSLGLVDLDKYSDATENLTKVKQINAEAERLLEERTRRVRAYVEDFTRVEEKAIPITDRYGDSILGAAEAGDVMTNQLIATRQAVNGVANAISAFKDKKLDLSLALDAAVNFKMPDIAGELADWVKGDKWRAGGGGNVEEIYIGIKPKILSLGDAERAALARELGALELAVKVNLGEMNKWEAANQLKDLFGGTAGQATLDIAAALKVDATSDEAVRKYLEGQVYDAKIYPTLDTTQYDSIFKTITADGEPTLKPKVDQAALDAARKQMANPIYVPLIAVAGKIPEKALGGTVERSQPYIVGERGPELFIPGQSGKIIPNNQLPGGSGRGIGGSYVDIGGIYINGGGQSPQAIAQAVIRQLNASMRSARQSGLGYVGS